MPHVPERPAPRLIQRGDLAVRLARALEIKGARGDLSLDNMVAPVVLIDDLTQNQQFLEPKAPGAGAAATLAAVVAEFSGIALYNPPDSKLVLVVDRIMLSIAAAGTVRIGRLLGGSAANPGSTYAAQPTFAAWLDSRAQGRPAGQIFTGSDPVSQLADWWHEMRVGSANAFEAFSAQGNPIVIGPGSALGVEHSLANSAFQCDLRWKEIASA